MLILVDGFWSLPEWHSDYRRKGVSKLRIALSFTWLLRLNVCITLYTVAFIKQIKHYCNTDGFASETQVVKVWETSCCAEQYPCIPFQEADGPWRSLGLWQSLMSLISSFQLALNEPGHNEFYDVKPVTYSRWAAGKAKQTLFCFSSYEN